jgi:hypothetical protein
VIDALLYAIRDGIRAAGIGYGVKECEIMPDGHPQPSCGNVFAAIHGGKSRSVADNQLDERFDFSITLTMRIVVALDRVGDQQIARNVPLVPLAYRQGFNAKLEQLRALLHMNWDFVVLTGRTPNSANDNITAWGTGLVYGFCEPMRYRGCDMPTFVAGEWFAAEPDAEDMGVKAELRFGDARRLQPVTQPAGPFV